MEYPKRILPHKSYKFIECDLSEHYLIRHFNLKPGDYPKDLSTGHIKLDYLFRESRGISDLSMNLLGVYEIAHIEIKWTNDGRHYGEYCPPNQEVDPPTHNQHFTIDSDRKYWVALIKDILSNPIDFTSAECYPFKAECKVEHTPTLGNFWHFSIRWKNELGYLHEMVPERERERVSRRLSHDFKAIAKMYASTEEPNYYELERACYVSE